MSKHMWCVAALATLLASTTSSRSLAKPPDLPADQNTECPGRLEGDLPARLGRIAGGVAVDLQAVRESDAPILDAAFPCVVPMIVARIQQEVVETWSAAASVAHEMVSADEPGNRVEQARQMYEIAERCRKQGDLDMARTCYQETHLLAPTSRYGRLAMQRLHELEQTGASTEEQEAPPSPPAPRSQKSSTQPLGLVPRSY